MELHRGFSPLLIDEEHIVTTTRIVGGFHPHLHCYEWGAKGDIAFHVLSQASSQLLDRHFLDLFLDFVIHALCILNAKVRSLF